MGFDRHILLCNYIPTKFWNISINPVYLTAPPSIQLLPEGDNCSDPYQYSLVLPILEFHLNKITDYALSLFSLFNMFERSPFTLLQYQKFLPFVVVAEQWSILSLYRSLFIQSSADKHLDFPKFGTIMSNIMEFLQKYFCGQLFSFPPNK